MEQGQKREKDETRLQIYCHNFFPYYFEEYVTFIVA